MDVHDRKSPHQNGPRLSQTRCQISPSSKNQNLCDEVLAEAWREGDNEYATVAMKFALKDSIVERASGRTVEGGEPSEVTELWAFMRARGANWLLSAVQQT